MTYMSPLRQLAVIPFKEDTGVGDESQIISEKYEDFLTYYFEPLSRQRDNPLIRFRNLEKEWKESTRMLSSITEIVMHPSYQEIIGMGPTAIPMILLSMSQEYDHWFWALSAITGANPVNIESRGKIKEMTAAWLEWGQKNYTYE